MTATLQTDITASVRWNQQDNDGSSARSVIDANAITLIDTLANGTGEDQADVIYHAQLSLTATPTTLDLTDGTMIDMLGNACVFDYIRTIMVTNADGGGYVTLAGTFKEYIAAPGASSGIYINENGCVLLHNPSANAWNVTASSNDTITLVSSNTSTVDIVIIGTT